VFVGAVQDAIALPEVEPTVEGEVTVRVGTVGAVSYVYWIESLPATVEPLSCTGLVPGEEAEVAPVAVDKTPKTNSFPAPVGDTEIEKLGLLAGSVDPVLRMSSGVLSACSPVL
jgi:hypothetical protein